MNRVVTALAGAGVLLASCSGAGNAPVIGAKAGETDFSVLLAGKSILFVGAHPDDESVSLAMMAEACLHGGASCHFVVVSDHKSYGCYLTIGLADLHECSRQRREEMLASAALANGEVEFYGWEEYFFAHNQSGLARNLADWGRNAGGADRLVARFRQTLDEQRPDVVIALDPRHGTSCHPNHRAASLLLMEAIATLPADSRPEVFFENNYYIVERMSEEMAAGFMNGGIYPWPDDPAPLHWYDASKVMPDGRQAYDVIVASLRAHATQYPDIAAGSKTPDPPASLRRVPYVKPADIDITADLCTALALEYPTFDVAGFPPNYDD